ncbi:hypothetical protein P409_15300 [Inquilinus limosus MP06]|uniref:Uncharacterized protein n=1 Tax=Inquilinus limosus MP06 TaxID=1398085 RepID=A0A0A0D488_9PROT|nr:hypothetical protein P409_15300 [Inquilinus limosus MP06]
MRLAAAVLGWLAIPALGGGSAAGQDRTLVLPRPLQPGEIAWLVVEVGPIGRREVTVSTAAGEIIGVISPFGPRAGLQAGVYPLPLPPEAIQDGRVVVRLTITRDRGPPRDPTAEEVPRVTVRIGP